MATLKNKAKRASSARADRQRKAGAAAIDQHGQTILSGMIRQLDHVESCLAATRLGFKQVIGSPDAVQPPNQMKFTVGTRAYNVRRRWNLRSGDDLYDGFCDQSSRTIWLRGELPAETIIDVLRHEHAHMWHFEVGVPQGWEGLADFTATVGQAFDHEFNVQGGLPALLRVPIEGHEKTLPLFKPIVAAIDEQTRQAASSTPRGLNTEPAPLATPPTPAPSTAAESPATPRTGGFDRFGEPINPGDLVQTDDQRLVFITERRQDALIGIIVWHCQPGQTTPEAPRRGMKLTTAMSGECVKLFHNLLDVVIGVGVADELDSITKREIFGWGE